MQSRVSIDAFNKQSLDRSGKHTIEDMRIVTNRERMAHMFKSHADKQARMKQKK